MNVKHICVCVYIHTHTYVHVAKYLFFSQENLSFSPIPAGRVYCYVHIQLGPLTTQF